MLFTDIMKIMVEKIMFEKHKVMTEKHMVWLGKGMAPRCFIDPGTAVCWAGSWV